MVTVLAGFNLNLMISITYIDKIEGNIPKKYINCSSCQNQLSINTQNRDKLTKHIFILTNQNINVFRFNLNLLNTVTNIIITFNNILSPI